MQDYNFWADLLATFRASPDAIKALWLVVPPAFVLGVIGLAMRGGRDRRKGQAGPPAAMAAPYVPRHRKDRLVEAEAFVTPLSVDAGCKALTAERRQDLPRLPGPVTPSQDPSPQP
ncbi:hypothetical protein [Rhizobium sp. SSA_523]|uniref:hypothetical protein n=1 Tax=Rhizobium sp. SSA_523 TaxID=2952477 RepID=UPI002091979F|nr:hypothetical protein [Rhizobium sp. SSA_523]MCO5733995.1 hypothetical protein [Rhizobium sp. SSA_523]WKC24639.1 hypothetical protein QTJ18_11400 [Rhizobium sp. SSA_523]